MSQLLLKEPSPTLRADNGLRTMSACWSPLAEREHRVVCMTSDVAGGMPPHMHAQHHFGIVERGAALLQSEGRHWALRPGDLIWHASRQLHAMFSEYCRVRWIALDEQVVERIVLSRGARVPDETRVFGGSQHGAEFLELHRRLERGAMTQSATKMLANVIAALGTALANIALLPPRLTPELERCRIAMRNGYADRVQLVDLARVAGMSVFHFARIFARALGVPPHAYLLHLRVAWAQSLLRRGFSGSRVAYESGFSDQSHCIRVHRRVLGVSPFAVLSLERQLPFIADGFAKLPNGAMRAAASVWLS